MHPLWGALAVLFFNATSHLTGLSCGSKQNQPPVGPAALSKPEKPKLNEKKTKTGKKKGSKWVSDDLAEIGVSSGKRSSEPGTVKGQAWEQWGRDPQL